MYIYIYNQMSGFILIYIFFRLLLTTTETKENTNLFQIRPFIGPEVELVLLPTPQRVASMGQNVHQMVSNPSHIF